MPEDASRNKLLIEFFRHCLHDPIVWKGTIKTMLIDQLGNLLYVSQLVISVQFIDHVLAAESGANREQLALFLAALHVVP
eukprot:2831496-Prymnesium_polylepis.1